jgi:hypothetical protein
MVNQSTIFTNWVKFAITVQAGLAAGLGVVLATSALVKHRPLGWIISLFGIAAAVSFAKILLRHVQWGRWYGHRCNELDRIPQIYPSKPNEVTRGKEWKEEEWNKLGALRREKEQWKKLGPVMLPVMIFLSLVAIAWVGIFVWLLFLENDAILPNPDFKTWNNCPLTYTIQGGMCKPYRGP